MLLAFNNDPRNAVFLLQLVKMKNPFRFGSPSVQEQNAVNANDPVTILQRSEFVFENWYREAYQVEKSVSVEQHYLIVGARQGANPNALFNAQWYLGQHPVVAASRLNPAVHYLIFGSKQGFRPNPYFDPAWYRRTYADVAASGIEPLVHYLKFGAGEGRNPCSDVVTHRLPQALDLRTGMAANPLVEFISRLDLLRSGIVTDTASRPD